MEQKEAKPWGIWLTAMLLSLAMVCSLAAAAVHWGRSVETAECFGQQRQYVIPVGHTVGIKLFSRGVMVVGLADVTTEHGEESPARQCGLRTGDIITHIDGRQVDTIEEVQSLLQATGGETMAIQLTRGGRMVETETAAVQCMTDGSYRLDVYKRQVPKVVDTTAAGDTFLGYFLSGMLDKLDPAQALQRATFASALTLSLIHI